MNVPPAQPNKPQPITTYNPSFGIYKGSIYS